MKFYSQNRSKMAKKPAVLAPKHDKIVLNSLSYQDGPQAREAVDPISHTVPDQSPDLRTLLQKGAQGYQVPQLPGQYTEQEIPDLELMDQVEILMYREELAEQMERLKEEHHHYTKELEKRKLDKDFQSKLDAEIAKRKQHDQTSTVDQP